MYVNSLSLSLILSSAKGGISLRTISTNPYISGSSRSRFSLRRVLAHCPLHSQRNHESMLRTRRTHAVTPSTSVFATLIHRPCMGGHLLFAVGLRQFLEAPQGYAQRQTGSRPLKLGHLVPPSFLSPYASSRRCHGHRVAVLQSWPL